MTERRILFVVEPAGAPHGGIATIYRHVEILAAHGLPAFVVLSKRPEVDFYRTNAPVLLHGRFLSSRRKTLRRLAREGDIWVVPEVFPRYLKVLENAPVRTFLFCQNHHYLAFGAEPGLGLSEFRAGDIIASSQTIQDYFRYTFANEVKLLPSYAIDPAIFKPASSRKRQIAFMPRKLRDDGVFIAATFKRAYPQFADVPWVAIENIPQHEGAKILGESAVLLALSHKESLGLPPLEAMASGCLVVGFHGEGGLEYMTERNGWWADAGDWKTCVNGLAAALDMYDVGGAMLDDRKAAMAETVARYSPARLERDLVAFWQRELAT